MIIGQKIQPPAIVALTADVPVWVPFEGRSGPGRAVILRRSRAAAEKARRRVAHVARRNQHPPTPSPALGGGGHPGRRFPPPARNAGILPATTNRPATSPRSANPKPGDCFAGRTVVPAAWWAVILARGQVRRGHGSLIAHPPPNSRRLAGGRQLLTPECSPNPSHALPAPDCPAAQLPLKYAPCLRISLLSPTNPV